MEINEITTPLSRKFLKFLAKLDQGKLSSKQKRLAKLRARVLDAARCGKKPTYKVDETPEWRREIPEWMQDQRNQMTGPANDAKLVVRMVNSHSPGVMLDLEDSCANTPGAIMEGHWTIKEAHRGTLKWGVEEIDASSPSVIWTRVRGLHMGQNIMGPNNKRQYTSASLFDIAMHFYDMELEDFKHDPCIYIPKSENSQEARWWRDAFGAVERAKGWKRGTIKAMALVESYPLAFELETFIYELQPYLVGLNLGRWDYMASFIDYHYGDFIFPDRNEIPTDVSFFQNLRKLIVDVCNRHGLFAIGGMTALYPNSSYSEEKNATILKQTASDKKNEAKCGFSGAWTGHPSVNDIAIEQFPKPNQIGAIPPLEQRNLDISTYSDLLELPTTLRGTKDAIKTCIIYRFGVLSGKGASFIDGYMEDLATDRIYRIIISQRLDLGIHDTNEVLKIFADIGRELGQKYDNALEETWRLIEKRQFNPK